MSIFSFITTIIVACTIQASVSDPPRGLYSSKEVISSHEIVYPRKVTHLGELLSHNVTHHHQHQHWHRRERRDLGNQNSVQDFKQEMTLHYRLEIDGREYHLQLEPAIDFIAPRMIVERRKREVHRRSTMKNHSSRCHYRGVIRDQPDSQVVLSACDGLAGFLLGDHGEAWLEPLAFNDENHLYPTSTSSDHSHQPQNLSTATSRRPHLLYRRVRGNDGSINDISKKNNGGGSSAAGARPVTISSLNRKEQGSIPLLQSPPPTSGIASKKKKKRRRKRHESNCGTREPRKLTETQLEWQMRTGLVQVQGRNRRKQPHNHHSHHHHLNHQRHENHHQQKQHRLRRSVSRARHVEALVVADPAMMSFHQDGDVEAYLLTIMNMVSALYLDPTIGNFINVVVVRIILMEEDEAEQGLNVTVNADKTLYNFCEWQQKLNPLEDSHPNHHDVAILVTREDICSRANTPCSTLGVAHVAGMCQPDRSCSVNEDNGITLAHTITHELGHNFGMYHDTEKIGCSTRDGDKLHVMTPTFEADTVGVAWSRCSRRDITNFLDQGKGECLEDEPADNDYAYPDLPPGALYNAEHQCRLQFAVRDASVCSPPEEICSKLWCVVDGVCTTMLHPAAPGTQCGKHMWCQNQQCVPMADQPSQIDGSWGEWSAWSECSRSCGAGISITERVCNHPSPANGGKFCIGERRRYKICNNQACPEGQASFRSLQCSKYDTTEYKGKNYTWLPYFDQAEPCKLYCTDSEESVIVPWGEFALDGTPCNVGTRDMCISGICRKVGCDWNVDSNATEDRCGICHGNGTGCITIRGLYEKNDGPGYRKVAVIPKGSRNIEIEEVGNSKNYIGIGRVDADDYFLNGKRQITLAGEYEIAGTLALYERDRDQEKVRIPGPIKEDIVLYLIYRGHYRNLGLRYEYTIPNEDVNQAPEYSWVFSDWSLCTATCGGGSQISNALCHEIKSGVVEDKFCKDLVKPEPITRECNIKPCPARWWVGPWQLCPVSCGESALRKRSIMCVSESSNEDQSELALPDHDCDKDVRPAEFEQCPDLPICQPTPETPVIVYRDDKNVDFYNISELLSNSTTSRGFGSSEIDTEILEFDNIIEGDSPGDENSPLNSNPRWQVSKWSQCVNGKRNRKVSCSSTDNNTTSCNVDNKPSDVEDCTSGKWATGKWGGCNATCSTKTGQKHREVTCLDRQTNLLSIDCNPLKKPPETKRCHHKKPCSEEKLGCKDSIDPVWKCPTSRVMCDASSVIREKCCATCSKRRKHSRHNRRQGVSD